MSYAQAFQRLLQEPGVEESTMMKTPCLRYQGNFLTMMFDKEEALIIKVSPERVNELIASGEGLEFNYTKKRFKEWVLIPIEYADAFESFMFEALHYAHSKS
ncbi:hypothetical protein [Marinicella sp. W31]|uniref:hypothetical protein n=1 Tax=Marinicella sp. W31 TaxID=3023713 RepID=UPI0037563F05